MRRVISNSGVSRSCSWVVTSGVLGSGDLPLRYLLVVDAEAKLFLVLRLLRINSNRVILEMFRVKVFWLFVRLVFVQNQSLLRIR